MKIVDDIAAMKSLAETHRRGGGRIGFVPTMGALHDGHLSLVRLARARLARSRPALVVASIFVNPTQFGPEEDFERYPRDPDRDCEMLEAEGCDLVFMPAADAMYREGYRTVVSVPGLSEKLCGRSRPGHFDGVATVVLKLLHVVRPDFAVFGQKDAQQLIIIRRMVEDLDLDVEIVAGPTIREADGLAASSRNRYLSGEERRQATCLFRALEKADLLFRSGERKAGVLVAAMRRIIEAESLVRPEYVSVVDPTDLEDLDMISGNALAALAVRVGRTRLIDNQLLCEKQKTENRE